MRARRFSRRRVGAMPRDCSRSIWISLSASCDHDYVVKALDLGAVGFIPKSGEREVMLSALRLVFSGGVYIPPEILAHPEPPTAAAPPPSPARRAGGSTAAAP